MLAYNLRRGTSVPVVLGIVALVIVVGGAFYYVTRDVGVQEGTMNTENETMMEDKDNAMMEDKKGETMNGDVMEKDNDAMVKDSEGAMVDKENDSMMQKGTYETYSPEKLSLASDGKVVLFFHAPWCPICRAIESEINANPDAISQGVHILKVDYDTAIQLRQKYGVTVQHTFVQVDAQGNMLAKWSDTSTLTQALSRIK